MTGRGAADIIARLEQAGDAEAVRAAVRLFCRRFGLLGFHFGARLHAWACGVCWIEISSHPGAWPDRRGPEPPAFTAALLRLCADRVTPLCWDGTEPVWRRDRRLHRFLVRARGMGLGRAACLPLHAARGGAAVFTVLAADRRPGGTQTLGRALPHACLLAGHLYQALERRLADEGPEAPGLRLTGRERQCLEWTAQGKKDWEIARLLGITRRTVIYHLQNAVGKLGAVNRYQAVARAVAWGLIALQGE